MCGNTNAREDERDARRVLVSSCSAARSRPPGLPTRSMSRLSADRLRKRQAIRDNVSRTSGWRPSPTPSNNSFACHLIHPTLSFVLPLTLRWSSVTCAPPRPDVRAPHNLKNDRILDARRKYPPCLISQEPCKSWPMCPRSSSKMAHSSSTDAQSVRRPDSCLMCP